LLDFIEKLEGKFFELGFYNESVLENRNDKSVRAEDFLIEQKHEERNREEEETLQ